MDNASLAAVGLFLFALSLVGSTLTIHRLRAEKLHMLRKNARLLRLVREALPLAVGETFVTTGTKRNEWYDHIARAREELGLNKIIKDLIDE